jgi:hypothetical protein
VYNAEAEERVLEHCFEIPTKEEEMSDRERLWPLLEEAMRAFSPFYREAMGKAIQDSGTPEHWWVLILVRGSDPVSFTLERFQAMSPYTAEWRLVDILDGLVRLELLERVGTDAYRLSGVGREVIEHIFEAAQRSMVALQPLVPGDMVKLNALLARLVEASLSAAEPREKWSIAYSRWTDPGEGAPEAVHTDQYLTDLLRFRDDAHIASWKLYGVDGLAWEALTFVWRGEASEARELAEKLSHRGYTANEYEEALQDLVARGWLTGEGGAYRATQEGQSVRQKAEEATDRIFFRPWSCLSAGEMERLAGLLAKLRDSLHEMAADG